MASKFLAILVLLCLCLNHHGFCEITNTNVDEDFELERELRSLNKPPVKTFMFKDGDIVDCIAIEKQPTLDHPLLKNHKIQIKPESYPNGLKNIPPIGKGFLAIYRRQACPKGTVPIQRTEKKDLVRAKSLAINENTANLMKGAHQVNVGVSSQDIYYGGSAFISDQNVTVAPDQSTSTNIWIQNGPPDQINVITTGWMASPRLFKDSVPRLFTYWRNGFKSGCFNTLCKGFVQIDAEFMPGYPIFPKIPGVPMGFTYLIYQDRQTGNWWFTLTGSDDSGKYLETVRIGYWPKELFTYLTDGTRHVYWGATAKAGNDGKSPPMGSGHMPFGDYKIDSFFQNLLLINEKNDSYRPSKTHPYIDKSGCYGIKVDGYLSKERGYAFTYGGRGGYCDRALRAG